MILCGVASAVIELFSKNEPRGVRFLFSSAIVVAIAVVTAIALPLLTCFAILCCLQRVSTLRGDRSPILFN